MDKLGFIKMALEHDLEYWENAQKEVEQDDAIHYAFYRGTIAGLKAFKEKIEFVFNEKENKTND